MSSLSLIQPDDWHVHLRDEAALDFVVPATALQFRRAIVMPNLKPPVVTVDQAQSYKSRIMAALNRALNSSFYTPLQKEHLSEFNPLMVLYLTANTSVDEIEKAKASGFVQAVKLYPAGATTNSENGVSDLLMQCHAVLEAMQRVDLPLLVHGEVTDFQVDVFDREAKFIDQVMKPLRECFPKLKIVFEHITTKQAAQYVKENVSYNEQGELLLAATITPQHLLFNRNALFRGGLQPHWYCLPVLKREEHRLALLEVATSGLKSFFLGTDSAPHAQHLKESACGCAGCYAAPFALQMYAEACEQVNRLDALERFASLNGPAFYGLPVNTRRVHLEKKVTTIPNSLPFVAGSQIVPFRAGEQIQWDYCSDSL